MFKRLRFLTEVVLLVVVLGTFRIVGLDRASAFGGWIGRHILYRLSGLMNRARKNLLYAYPDMSEAERETIIRKMCDNLGRTFAEYAHLDKFSSKGPDPRLEIDNFSIVDAALVQGKGAIFFSGHFANWELMPFAAAQMGIEGGEVYRPQNNPMVNRWLVGQRTKNGPAEQITKGAHGAKRIFTLLRKKRSIFLLADQKTNEGLPVPFFGREAMTTPLPALLALKLGVLLIPASNKRLKGSRFRVTVHPPIEFIPTGDHDHDVFALTSAVNNVLELCVREDPSQWLWIHQRWPTERQADQTRGKRATRTLSNADSSGHPL